MMGPKQISFGYAAVAAAMPSAVAEGKSALNRPLGVALAGAKGALTGAIRLTFYLLLVAVVLARSSQARRRRKTF